MFQRDQSKRGEMPKAKKGIPEDWEKFSSCGRQIEGIEK